jgi:molecular chaperone DnaK (HSP70)
MNGIRARAVLAATALALTALVAGCGGDDGLTAKEFRAKADKLCAAADKETEKLGEGLSSSSSEKEVTGAIDKLVDRTEELVDDIDALEEPESLSKEVDAMLDSLRKGLKKLDDASLEDLTSMENPLAEADTKAKKLGLEKCGG